MLLTEIMDWERVRAEAGPIRFAVFVDEQKVPAEIELDEHDAASLHVIVRSDGRAVGTGRLLPTEMEGSRARLDGAHAVSHIGRMAVRREFRGRGVGAAMLLALIDAARARGDGEIVLSAQIHALGFYCRFGFVAEGGAYLDAGIEHQSMRITL